MQEQIQLGDVGALKFSIEGGKAKIEIIAQEKVLNDAIVVQGGASAVVDAGVLVDLIFAEIEKKSPPGLIPIEETVKAIVKQAVLAIQ